MDRGRVVHDERVSTDRPDPRPLRRLPETLVATPASPTPREAYACIDREPSTRVPAPGGG